MPPPHPALTAKQSHAELWGFDVQYFESNGQLYANGRMQLEVYPLEGETACMRLAVTYLKYQRSVLPTGSNLPGLPPGAGADLIMYVSPPEGDPVLILPTATALVQ